MEALEREPEGINAARRRNVAECLLRHDWINRWLEILDVVGLEPCPTALHRVERLSECSDSIQHETEPRVDAVQQGKRIPMPKVHR